MYDLVQGGGQGGLLRRYRRPPPVGSLEQAGVDHHFLFGGVARRAQDHSQFFAAGQRSSHPGDGARHSLVAAHHRFDGAILRGEYLGKERSIPWYHNPLFLHTVGGCADRLGLGGDIGLTDERHTLISRVISKRRRLGMSEHVTPYPRTLLATRLTSGRVDVSSHRNRHQGEYAEPVDHYRPQQRRPGVRGDALP